MAFPLGAVLAAAPGIISAAADIIRVIRERNNDNGESVDAEQQSVKLEQLSELVERQAQLIEELAVSNSKLAMEVRNNRIFSVAVLVLAGAALLVSFT